MGIFLILLPFTGGELRWIEVNTREFVNYLLKLSYRIDVILEDVYEGGIFCLRIIQTL